MLKGKTALVTGSTSGIGLGIARALARQGANVVLNGFGDVAGPKAEVAALGVRAGYHGADMSKPAEIEAMMAYAASEFGGVDVLVNNAGIRIRHPFGEYSAAEFDKLIAINVRAAFLASQAVLPAMRAQGGGRIIHVASQMGLVAHHDSLLYGLSKAAVIYLTQAMAYELAKDHIIVNAVSPGPIMTEYNRERTARDPALLKDRLGYLPIGRYGEPEEVARTIVLLASATPEFLQGHNLVIDGGYTSH
jgi:NAD(P)-dependent dehydrogenase (short-subunit alcohol dehydrogenase family)